MHPVETFIRERIDPPQEEIDQFIARMKLRTLKRGEQFCEMGQVHHELGLLLEGKMRVFTLTEEGNDVTLDFIFPVGPVVSLAAATADEPSQLAIEALEECELGVWPFSIRDELIEYGDRSWMKLIQMELDRVFRRRTAFAISRQSKDAATRYREALKLFPPAASRLPQYYLASYLGILPQSLSRIRAQLGRSKKN
ncbi:MAG TPA: Crp/Fnr family transcriptional regulator [Acetobacteraceae bacterium]|nr:Crp/Fnr family transcriptional regulator [Acetobacteraceae bacterium]